MKITSDRHQIKVNSLIRLAEDPDPIIYDRVKVELIKMGDQIIPDLEDHWSDYRTEEPHRERLFEIIRQIRINEIKLELEKWRASSNRDLLRGATIISKFQFPHLDHSSIEVELEKIKQKVWLEINEEHTAFEIVKIFNHVLFDICGFQIGDASFYSPQSSFIHSVLESRKGNQLSLSMIYSIIAQKLEIPIYGIDLPNQFVLGFVDQFQTLKMLGLDEHERNILFYINPVSKGRIFDQNEIEHYLRSLNLPLRNDYFVPCSNTEILKRLIGDLTHAYNKVGEDQKARELQELNHVLCA